MTAMINVNLFNSERCYGLDKEHSFLFVCSDKLSRLKRQG
ncbi:hypothetical protein A8806_10739 [Faecalicatena orotica]|uniref:Uncharacterized protein n=1 Tax=Faecalicatena orotica TaxID=1544 RepID=A0A2Y9CA37_9FIRM|nr:hypothetical protein A8806_10739 [Faecalicatena orotica]SSA56060.1 hypothetical protein SAMN05216536_10739 [Faecalicatena orotica]